MKVAVVSGSIILIAVGAAVLAMGLDIRSAHSPYADGIVTTATMSSFNTERTTNRHRRVWTTHYRPVYTFQTRAGEMTTLADPKTFREPPRLGRTVELSYRAKEPGRARVLRGWHGWTFFPIVFTAAGAFILAFVVYATITLLARDRADQRS